MSPSVSFSHFYSSQINSMKFLQQLNRQSALMRHRGHGDRGRKETGAEVSMAMRCVSEACDCNTHFPVCEMCVSSVGLERNVACISKLIVMQTD